jgi:AcrR family transcriptional regulator
VSQLKKPEVRDAILRSAWRLFRKQGYTATTLADIARGARVSPANVYVYFKSKLHILYALYDPWLRRRIMRLAARVRRMRDPGRRLRLLLRTLWQELPAAQNGFANNLMQAVTTSTPEEKYDPALLHWVEEEVAAMLRDILPPDSAAALGHRRFSHLVMMAFDGFVIHHHLRPQHPCRRDTIELFCRLVLGPPPPS